MSEAFNPRFLIWCRAEGLSLSILVRQPPEWEMQRVRDRGWTEAYSEWIIARWGERAAELGFSRGSTPWREALMAGHSEKNFDSWLAAKFS